MQFVEDLNVFVCGRVWIHFSVQRVFFCSLVWTQPEDRGFFRRLQTRLHPQQTWKQFGQEKESDADLFVSVYQPADSREEALAGMLLSNIRSVEVKQDVSPLTLTTGVELRGETSR